MGLPAKKEPAPSAESVDEQRLAAGKSMFEGVAAEFGGNISPWEPTSEGTVGLWEYTSLTIGETVLRVGVSGGGVVSVNQSPFDPEGKVNDTPEAVRKSIAALLPVAGEPATKSPAQWWQGSIADKYAAVYLLGKSRGKDYLTLTAQGDEYLAHVKDGSVGRERVGAASAIVEWLRTDVFVGMGDAFTGDGLSVSDVRAKLKLVKGDDVLFAESAMPATSQPGLSQFPVVGSDPIWGDIIEVPTVYGDKTRVARAQLEDSSRKVLAQYTKAGKRKPGYGINRGNLLIGGAELAYFAQLEKEMRESGQWEVARYPRSPEQQMKLLGQGYTGYLKDERTGEMIPSPLGLVWAKPIAQAVEAPEDGAQTVEAVCRWLASLGWTVSQPDERGDVVASLDGMDVSLGASPTGQLDYDGEPLDTQLSAKEAAYLIHGEYRYGDEEENRRRLGINDPDADDPDSDEWKTDAFTKSALIVKDTAERLGGRVSFGDFSSSVSGGLFDSVAAVPYGICAQIGAAGKGVGRAAIEEDGKALIYVGLSGEEVITVGGVPSAPDASHAAIIGMVEALLARQAPERPASENGEKPSAEDDMSRARAATETSPTDEQKESGNYQKGEISLFGLDIAIENPQGSTRSGKSKDGTEWSNTMQADYGFIRNTLGADGDEVDVFVGPDLQNETAFVISQVGKEGEFDEYKALLGFTSEADARSAYLSSYGPGWSGLGSIRAMSIDEFKAWLGSEAPRTAPAPATPRQETDMQPVQPPQESTVKGDDRRFLESILNNTVADILAPELGDQIGTVYERNAEDAEMLSLIEQAVMAYQRAMEQATASL